MSVYDDMLQFFKATFSGKHKNFDCIWPSIYMRTETQNGTIQK